MRRQPVSGVAVAVVLMLAFSPPPSAVADGGWTEAHATFYGDESGAETMSKQTISSF
jgi:hypothetical protein